MCPSRYLEGGSLLHCLSTLTKHPYRHLAVYFCCTGLGVTSTGRYPASCPMKPGLSSPVKKQPRSLIPLVIYLYTLKQLPPTNSLTIEFVGSSSLPIPKKYPKNFRRRFASKYSGSSFLIPNSNGSA